MKLRINFAHSTLIAALIATALVNGWIALGHPFRRVPTANLDRGEALQSVAAYKGEIDKPDLVLLGSSLVIAPVMQADSNLLQQPVPRMTHRRSLFVEKELSHGSKSTTKVFCLAVGGAMVSDSYLMLKNVILTEAKKPRAIIYGIAPRDFQDNLLPGIESTESFRGLANLGDLFDCLKSRAVSFERAADLSLERLCPLWLYRADARVYAGLRAKKMLEAIMPWVVFDKYGETLELKPRRRGMFPEEAKGTPSIYPGLAMDHVSWSATRSEYLKRYIPLAPQLINREFAYLDKLIVLCKQNDIELAIVNMPLSRDNISIFPEGFYSRYRERLTKTCSQHAVSFIDLCSPQLQNNALYVDGVHLDSSFSQQFMHLLSDKAKQTLQKTRTCVAAKRFI